MESVFSEIKTNTWGIPLLFVICAPSPWDSGSRTTDNSPRRPDWRPLKQPLITVTPGLQSAAGPCVMTGGMSVQLCFVTHAAFACFAPAGLQFLIMEWGEGGSHVASLGEPGRNQIM